MAAEHNGTTTVTAYMRGNGLLEGFLDIELKQFPAKNITYLVDVCDQLFLGRKTKRAVFVDPSHVHRTDVEMIVLYDVGLQHAPPGFIKCPYLLLRRNPTTKLYQNLTVDHKQDILSTIESLQDEQAAFEEQTESRAVNAYYIAAGRWSGLVPVIISETHSGNFTIPTILTFFPNVHRIKSCVVEIKGNIGYKRFFCILDRTLHNNGTYDCPYLLFRFGHGYPVQHATEDDVVDVALVLQRLKKELENEPEQ